PSQGAYGDIRGWDARTGKLLWTFHTVPRPGEAGSETWPADAWKNRSGTNVWGFFSIDVKRGMVYAPLGSPTSDFYGADRIGGNPVFFPSTLGGGNWGGVSIGLARGLLFANVMHIGQWGHMEKRGAEYTRTSAYGPYARFWNRETRIPCQNPPFGEMIAVDLA